MTSKIGCVHFLKKDIWEIAFKTNPSRNAAPSAAFSFAIIAFQCALEIHQTLASKQNALNKLKRGIVTTKRVSFIIKNQQLSDLIFKKIVCVLLFFPENRTFSTTCHNYTSFYVTLSLGSSSFQHFQPFQGGFTGTCRIKELSWTAFLRYSLLKRLTVNLPLKGVNWVDNIE